MLDKKSFLGRKPAIKKVFIESMNDEVHIKEYIVSERNQLRESGIKDMQILSLILGVCDADGVPLFTMDDIEDISRMPQLIADELFYAVIAHNEPEDKAASAKN